jgi:hypothetical protein
MQWIDRDGYDQNPGVSSASGGSSTDPTYVTTIRTNQTASIPTHATVGTSSAQVIASNTSRTGLVLINDSSAKIYLGIGANAAVVGSGIMLYPNGVYDMSEYDFVQSAINAIAGTAGNNLTIQEFV